MQAFHGVCGHQQHPAGLCHLGKNPHEVGLHARIQPAGWLIKDEQPGAGEQFQCHADALSLATGQAGDAQMRPVCKTQLLQQLVHALGACSICGLGKAQAGGVRQRRTDRQRAMQGVILWHVSHRPGLAHLKRPHAHLPRIGFAHPQQHFDERALAGAGWPNERAHLTRQQLERDG